MPFDWIEHIVIVMMENRSLDHMLGHLSLPGSPYVHKARFEGLKRPSLSWPPSYENRYGTQSFFPTPLTHKETIPDPGHERANVRTQLNVQNNVFGMNGFVSDYMSKPDKRKDPTYVMGYYSQPHLPVYDYFATHYAVCDHWFAPLPAATHPNRLMALCGYTEIDENISYLRRTLPDQDFLFDWLNRNKVSWRIYQDGVFSFFSMLSRGTHRFYDNVRSVRDLDSDLAGYDSATFPKVLWIEPEYTLGWSNGDDDHPPAAVRDGQEFLGKLYKVFRKKKDFWSKTLMIVTYDEHGGFFDHLPPLPVVTNPPGGLKRSYPDFTSSGIRVPGFLISPYVLPQSLYSGNVDHTSILKLIGARFAPDQRYSDAVNLRGAGILGGLGPAILPKRYPVPHLQGIDGALRELPGYGDTPSAYESSYREVARNVARQYVYVGPKRAPADEELLPPAMLGLIRETDQEPRKRFLRNRAIIIQALLTGDLSPSRKKEFCRVHQMLPRELNRLIQEVVINARRSLR